MERCFFEEYGKAEKSSHQMAGGKLIDTGRTCRLDYREQYEGIVPKME